MTKRRIHFLYDEKRAADAEFAAKLVKKFGQSALETATHVVSVGGDGKLLQALALGSGKIVAGVVSPGSNSAGFWTNKKIKSAAAFGRLIDNAPTYSIKPLKAEIEFGDGSKTKRYAYNEFCLRPDEQILSEDMRAEFGLSKIDSSVQSILLNFKARFNEASVGPFRIMGGGIIAATAFGSSSMNAKYDGPIIDIRNEAIILTGIGIAEPRKGFPSVVNKSDAVLEFDVQSQGKRPVLMTFDSFAVKQNEEHSPLRKIKISMAHERATQILLADDPGLRAYAAMTI